MSVYPDSEDDREDAIDLNFSPNFTHRQYMCSFALKGKMYLVGGYESVTPGLEYRQFRVGDDKQSVVQLDDLPFEMRNGQCVTYSEDYALLCSSYRNA